MADQPIKPRKSIKFSASLTSEPIAEKKLYRKTEVPELPKIFKYEEESEAEGIRLPKYEKEPQMRLTRASILQWRDDSIDLSQSSYKPRLVSMFDDIAGFKRRSTVIVRPIEKLLPTYQLESKKPFEPRIAEDIMKSIIDDRMKSFTRSDAENLESIARSLSEDILFHIKLKEFNRYRILVSVTLTERFFQHFSQHEAVLWDSERDMMATYTLERSTFFITANVYGIYFE